MAAAASTIRPFAKQGLLAFDQEPDLAAAPKGSRPPHAVSAQLKPDDCNSTIHQTAARATHHTPSVLDGLPGGLVWTGRQMAANTAPGIPTGFAELDSELPGHGWPRDTLIELITHQYGIGEITLLQPLMRTCPPTRWIAWIAPPLLPYAPALAHARLPLPRLLLIDTQDHAARLWSCRQALTSLACHAVLAWFPHIDAAGLRRLQLAAEASGTPLFLFRPPAAAAQHSPARLRLQLRGQVQSLQLHILKRRGPPVSSPIELPIHHLSSIAHPCSG